MKLLCYSAIAIIKAKAATGRVAAAEAASAVVAASAESGDSGDDEAAPVAKAPFKLVRSARRMVDDEAALNLVDAKDISKNKLYK